MTTTALPEGASGATPIRGLSSAEVIARRRQGLGNNARISTSRTYTEIIRENVFTFINNVLFVLGVFLVLLGRTSDAVTSVGVAMLNVVVSVVQEIRAKRKLDQIALLTRPKATVIRDGVEQAVDPSEIVVGDILVVRPGDQIVVDGVVVGDDRMDVDESLLTGESDVIPKRLGDHVYSGSYCVTGTAHYEAQKVGTQSLAHQITAGARAFRRVLTPLQRQVNLVIRVLLLIMVYLQIMLTVNAFLSAIPIVESVKIAVVVAGLVPQGLFLAIALSYAVGAVRIAGHGALVQQANAVESLSNVDTLCLDKTGTLTANRIAFYAMRTLTGDEERVARLLGRFAASATSGNRTSEAIRQAFPDEAHPIADEAPFSSARKWSGLTFAGGDERGTYILGAPEMIRPGLAADADLGYEAQMGEWTERGLRVLLFAGVAEPTRLTEGDAEPTLPPNLTPLALIALQDELRPEAQETLAGFLNAGIRVKIISGDTPETVAALARQAGLPKDIQTVSGLELARMSPAEFAQTAEDATVFGRITPQQKEALVKAMRSHGHYVAMIGDGVNDVLSLKQANLGIAMESGSQATRGVADIILLNDSFASLPYAFREGQRILNGMQDILKLFLTRVLTVTLLVLSTGLIGGFPFTPKQASLVALLSVGLPTLALAGWAKPGMTLKHSPIRALLHFVIPAALTLSLVGLMVYSLFVIVDFETVERAADSVDVAVVMTELAANAQTALALTLTMGGLLLLSFVEPPIRAFAGGNEYRGDWRPTILAVALFAALVFVVITPPLAEFFELTPLEPAQYLFIGVVVVVWALMLRWVWRQRVLDRFLSADMGEEIVASAR